MLFGLDVENNDETDLMEPLPLFSSHSFL